ncbi:MAG: NAD(P)H-dependent oxidoreductase [Actinomycetota bacterium]
MKGSSAQYLHDRAAQGRPITLGLIGVGQMGAGIVAQSAHLPGIKIRVLADIDPERARRSVARLGIVDPLVTDDPDDAAQAAGSGRTVITTDAELVPHLPLDVVVEATGIPEVGVRVGLAAAHAKRNLVSMNVEADVTIGRFLRREFELSGAVYTLAAGDEPSCAWELVDFARTIGLDVVVAGKGKNNPLRANATPSSVADEAERKKMNPRMLAAFVDGTKTMCEMCCLANATGFRPDVPGMHGPDANSADLASVFKLREEGGLLSQTGVVDYVTGDVAPGVFVVVHSDDEEIVRDLNYLQLGPGPYWALVRPYHLANLEVPMTIVRVVRDGSPTLAPVHRVAEVAAKAKRDLRPGDRVEGIGDEQVLGFTYSASDFDDLGLVPLGLTEHAMVVKPVTVGDPLTFDDVELDESSALVRAWYLQQHLDRLDGYGELAG